MPKQVNETMTTSSRNCKSCLQLECLEDRTVPAGVTLSTAQLLDFNNGTRPLPTAQVSSFLASADQVDFYQISLQQGDVISAELLAQRAGSGLDSFLRIFDSAGNAIASNDNFHGTDSALTFQASQSDDYFLAISSAGNNAFDPNVQGSGVGFSTGLYTLNLTRDNAALQADLVGASFEIVETTAADGDAITINYVIQNRGGASTGTGFDVTFRLSDDSLFDGGEVLLSIEAVGPLAAGASFVGTLNTTFTDLSTNKAFVGMEIDSADAIAELSEDNNTNQRQGTDFDSIFAVTEIVETEPNEDSEEARNSPEAIVTNVRILGSIDRNDLGDPGDASDDDIDVDVFLFEQVNFGRLTVFVQAEGFDARLTLVNRDGESLIQSDATSLTIPDNLLAQHLDGDDFFLQVSARGPGTGTYELTTIFEEANAPFDLITLGSKNGSIAQGDFNRDGIADLVAVPNGGVLLGRGDSTFVRGENLPPNGATAVVVAHLDEDQFLDIALAQTGTSPEEELVIVLLGNGDGTFRNEDATGNPLRFAAPGEAVALAAGDVDGDGRVDLVSANSSVNAVEVFLNQGGGQFQIVQDQFAEAAQFGTADADDVTSVPIDVILIQSNDDNGDGAVDDADFLDVVTANRGGGNVSVLFGDGNGGFGPPQTTQVVTPEESGTVGDAPSVQKEPGGPQPNSEGRPLTSLVAGQFTDDNNDGLIDEKDNIDLVVADAIIDFRVTRDEGGSRTQGGVTLLTGDGQGGFVIATTPQTGLLPNDVVTGDFNADGLLDVATANLSSSDFTVLLNNGNNGFQPAGEFPVGSNPSSLVAADLDRDGRVDIASVNFDEDLGKVRNAAARGLSNEEGNLAVLRGLGNGTFEDQVNNPINGSPASFARVLLDQGGGDLVPVFGSFANPIITEDFNNDGNIDVAIAKDVAEVAILLGEGDGTFEAERRVASGAIPVSLVAGDFNGDGRRDLATVNFANNSVSILLGFGDGSFSSPRVIDLGFLEPENALFQSGPIAIVTGQFNDDNNDGIVNDDDFLDLATANFADLTEDGLAVKNLNVLFGIGDGSFQQPVAVEADPVFDQNNGEEQGPGLFDVISGDFDNDGDTDLATVSPSTEGGGIVNVLLSDGVGSFERVPNAVIPFSVGEAPTTLVAGQFTDDNGDGQFGDGDFMDLAIGSQGNEVLILLGQGDGTFFGFDDLGSALRFDVNASVNNLTTGDFNNDGITDLATSEGITGGLDSGLPNSGNRVLLGVGDGTFTGDFGNQAQTSIDVVSDELLGVASGDFNNDGFDDLAYADFQPNSVFIQLAAQFDPATINFVDPGASLDIRSNPTLIDVNGDNLEDALVLNEDGRILLRLRVDSSTFASPQILNRDLPGLNPGDVDDRRARAFTPLQFGGETRIAATDFIGDRITLYRMNVDGTISIVDELSTSIPTFINGQIDSIEAGLLVSRIISDDLTGDGDGFDDLAVLFQSNSEFRIAVLLADGTGGFESFEDEAAGTIHDYFQVDLDGNGPVDLIVTEITGDLRPELVLANQISGDVTVIENRFDELGFERHVYRAGNGPFAITNPNRPLVRSREKTSSVAAGDFNRDGLTDLVTANTGANTFGFLNGLGSFANPVVTQLGFSPAQVIAGQLNDDNGDGGIDENDNLDLAFLHADGDEISIFLGDGNGGFTPQPSFDNNGDPAPIRAGTSATGFSIVDVNEDGNPDLQVGNAFGDLLFIRGNGDGTFEPFTGVGRAEFVTSDVDGDGDADAFLANEAQNEFILQQRDNGADTFTPGNFQQDQNDGLDGPVAPVLADLDADGFDEMIVANSAANTISVFDQQLEGSFTARSFFVGSRPTELQVVQLNDDNGDGVIDNDDVLDVVIANEGSNDVSILFGTIDSGVWTPTPGPRLAVGNGPIAAQVVADQNNDGVPDLQVVDGQDGTIRVLPGIGNGGNGTGFFDDNNPVIVNLPNPANPGTPPIIVNTNQNFLFTSSGAILDANTATTVFFDPTRAAQFADPFQIPGSTAPDLFVVFTDGSLSRLSVGLDGFFAEVDTILGTGIFNPSELRALAFGDGVELYLSEQGSSFLSVFRFDIELGIDGSATIIASPGTAALNLTSVDTQLGFIATVLLGNGAFFKFELEPEENLSELNGDESVSGFDPNLQQRSNLDGGSGNLLGAEIPPWLAVLVDKVIEAWPKIEQTTTQAVQQITSILEQMASSAGSSGNATIEVVGLSGMPVPSTEIGGMLEGLYRDLGESTWSILTQTWVKIQNRFQTQAPTEPDTPTGVVTETEEMEEMEPGGRNEIETAPETAPETPQPSLPEPSDSESTSLLRPERLTQSVLDPVAVDAVLEERSGLPAVLLGSTLISSCLQRRRPRHRWPGPS